MHKVSRLGEGDTLGEAGLGADAAQYAHSVVASSEVVCLVLKRELLRTLVARPVRSSAAYEAERPQAECKAETSPLRECDESSEAPDSGRPEF